MAYIPIAEVPNAPQTQEMPLADYPDIPSIRYKGIDMKVNMGPQTQALQKSELPGGFAQGLARAAASAGEGTKAMSEAVGGGLEQMGKVGMAAAGILHKIRTDELDSRDSIDEIRAQNNRALVQDRFEADKATHGWNEVQAAEQLPKYFEDLGKMNAGLGVRQTTREKIQAQDSGFANSYSYKTIAKAGLESQKNDLDLANGKIATAKERGDAGSLAAGRDANDRLHSLGRINDAQHQKNDDDMNKSARHSTHLEQVAKDPEWAKDQADKARRGEANDMFDNTDTPDEINAFYGHATTELNKVREENFDDIHARLLGGEHMSIDQVKDEAKAKHLSAKQTATLLTEQKDQTVAYDPTKVAKAMSMATDYDATKDVDKEGKPSIDDFTERQKFIVENVPKEYRAEMLKDLRESRKSTKDGAMKSPQQAELALADSALNEYANAGQLHTEDDTHALIPSGITGTGDKRKIDAALKQESDRRVVQIKRNLREYARLHPDFGPNELLDYMHLQVQGIVEKNITANLKDPKSVPMQSTTRPGYYQTLGIPGAGNIYTGTTHTGLGEGGIPKELTPAEYEAKIHGQPAPTAVGPTVSVHVYDAENYTFRDAPVAATPELQRQLEREQEVYSKMLGGKDDMTIHDRLNIVGSDVLEPQFKGGLGRAARERATEKGISQSQAIKEIIQEKADRARADVISVRDALKTDATKKAAATTKDTFPGFRTTNYVPGLGGIEGRNETKDRPGQPAYTMEDYNEGSAPYVSVAVQDGSPLRGKMLSSPQFPGIRFKAEDIGPAVQANQVDIAWRDPAKATTGSRENVTFQVVSGQGKPKEITSSAAVGGAPLVATIEHTGKGPGGVGAVKGTLNVNGTPYEYVSGGYGRGSLPPGEYVVTEHMPKRSDPGFTVGSVGFSFALSDKYDSRVAGTRSLLRIHPDGGTQGTAGCIGIQGGPDQQIRFRDDLTAAIRRNGGKVILRVG